MNQIWDAITTYFVRLATYNWYVVAIELALIGAVVWWVMRFLRGTRGARLVKGVALTLATVYVVILLLQNLPSAEGESQWERIQFLYERFLLFAFVATVVAFQPELRRALIQIGQTRLFRRHQREVLEMIDTLVDSAAFLSRNKIGAIVAVERTVGLGALMATGTPLDAELTTGLLNTIFYPGSALHDMGVILHGNRIATAGVQFPLAESEEADPSLGSRHRAALGLAKESDAVVLVVSEETGRISVACEGQLYLGLEPAALRDMLLGLLASPSKARKPQGDSPATAPAGRGDKNKKPPSA